MKRITALFLLLALCAGCSEAAAPGQEVAASPYTEVNTLDGVELTIRPDLITTTGLDLTLTAELGREYLFGEQFVLEREVDGDWIALPLITDDQVTWIDQGFCLGLRDSTAVQSQVNWTWIYGELGEGTYRIVKTVSPPDAPEEKYHLAAEFTLTGDEGEDQLRTAPDLQVHYRENGTDKVFSLSSGVGEWTYMQSDGTGTISFGCGAVPLDMVESLHRLDKTEELDRVSLSFTAAPQSCNAKAWCTEDAPLSAEALDVPIEDGTISLLDDGRD